MKWPYQKVVADTNFLVSAFLFDGSLPSLCLSLAQRSGTLLTSIETFSELTEVFMRPKFDRYSSVEARIRCLADFRESLKVVKVNTHVQDCQDSADNKFLELALCGNADFIITGDAHLLALHPWRGVNILTPRQYFDL